jgi:hypothetical protein
MRPAFPSRREGCSRQSPAGGKQRVISAGVCSISIADGCFRRQLSAIVAVSPPGKVGRALRQPSASVSAICLDETRTPSRANGEN